MKTLAPRPALPYHWLASSKDEAPAWKPGDCNWRQNRLSKRRLYCIHASGMQPDNISAIWGCLIGSALRLACTSYHAFPADKTAPFLFSPYWNGEGVTGIMQAQPSSTTHQTPGGAMTIEEWLALINSKLDRIIGAYFPDEKQAESRFFLDSLKGMSVDEMRKANRERNRRLKEQRQREQAHKSAAFAPKRNIMGRAA